MHPSVGQLQLYINGYTNKRKVIVLHPPCQEMNPPSILFIAPSAAGMAFSLKPFWNFIFSGSLHNKIVLGIGSCPLLPAIYLDSVLPSNHGINQAPIPPKIHLHQKFVSPILCAQHKRKCKHKEFFSQSY